MQSQPDGPFNWILAYVDHGAKFCWSAPLVSKRQSSVAYALIRLFTIIGPPLLLQADKNYLAIA